MAVPYSLRDVVEWLVYTPALFEAGIHCYRWKVNGNKSDVVGKIRKLIFFLTPSLSQTAIVYFNWIVKFWNNRKTKKTYSCTCKSVFIIKKPISFLWLKTRWKQLPYHPTLPLIPLTVQKDQQAMDSENMQPEMDVWWEQESSSRGITETSFKSQESGKG